MGIVFPSPAMERWNWHAIGQEFVSFRVLDRPGEDENLRSLDALSFRAPGSGRERHSEHGGRAFHGRGPRPVNAPERSAAEGVPRSSRDGA